MKKLMYNWIIIIVILLLFLIVLNNILSRDINTFMVPNNINKVVYEKDRTKLYGSLFLDKLNEQIKEMTDPRIQYDQKRIDIIKYSDILL